MPALESSPMLFLAMIATMGITATALLKVCPTLLTQSTSYSAEYIPITGLRGLLAACVFVHHSQVSRSYFRDGVWLEPSSSFYSFAGTGCVSVFFMITGFLFWGKVLDGKLHVLSLLTSRVRRILPVYMVSFLLILAVCTFHSNFSISRDWIGLAISILRWLGGGLLGQPDIAGVSTKLINCDVTWTLQYEWFFYFTLPLISICSSPARFALLTGVFFICLFGLKRIGYENAYHSLIVAVPFFGGMLSAYAVRVRQGELNFPRSLASGFVAASFFFGALAYRPGNLTLVAIGLFPAFAAIAIGADVFGLLRLHWVRLLGEISFSLYLLHGIILMSVLGAIDRFLSVGRIPYYGFIILCSGLSAIVVLASTLTFTFVERRWMQSNTRKVTQSTALISPD